MTNDQFYVSIGEPSTGASTTKRNVTSDVAKVFDALGFLSPATIKMKILLQRLWELKIAWDDPVTKMCGDDGEESCHP